MNLINKMQRKMIVNYHSFVKLMEQYNYKLI